MANILNIKTSISGEDSVSSRLSQVVIDRLLEKEPFSKVVVRNLATEPIPHMGLEHFSAFNVSDAEKTDAQKELSRFSDQAIMEIHDADIIVIGVPFYNFSIPSTLKSWIDHISIAGKTFSYADGHVKGLLKNKRSILTLRWAVSMTMESWIIWKCIFVLSLDLSEYQMWRSSKRRVRCCLSLRTTICYWRREKLKPLSPNLWSMISKSPHQA